jgi:hypothetical protein
MDIQILRVKGEPFLVIGDKDPNANPMTVGEWSLMVGDRVRYEELESSLSVEDVLSILKGNYRVIVDGEDKGSIANLPPSPPPTA